MKLKPHLMSYDETLGEEHCYLKNNHHYMSYLIKFYQKVKPVIK